MIVISQGDTPVFDLTAQTGDGTGFDLTGAVFTSFIRAPNGAVSSFANSQHAANGDQVANPGKFTLTLLSTDTLGLAVGDNRELITMVAQGSSTIYFHGPNLLKILPNVPVQ